jgi:hypothetical protein
MASLPWVPEGSYVRREYLDIFKDIPVDNLSYHWFVRAVQGHSLPYLRSDRLGAPLTPDHLVFVSCLRHTTYMGLLPSIVEHGLVPEGQCVHLSPFAPHEPRYESGVRHAAPVVIYVKPAATLLLGDCRLTPAGAVMAHNPIPPQLIQSIEMPAADRRSQTIRVVDSLFSHQHVGFEVRGHHEARNEDARPSDWDPTPICRVVPPPAPPLDYVAGNTVFHVRG